MKKALSLILALCMLLAAVPFNAFAAPAVETARLEREAVTVLPEAMPEPVETNGRYSVSITYTGKGKVKLYSTSADAGDAVYFLADPEPGYLMDASYSFWQSSYNGEMYYLGNNLCVLYMPASDAEIEVTFTPASGDNHKINLNVWNGGTVKLSQDKAKYGECIMLEIQPNRGYEFAGMEAKTASGSYVDVYDATNGGDVMVAELEMPNEDVNVEVAFERVGNPFVDVKEKDFFYDPVMWAVDNGITNGTDATHFSPLANCNRAQVVTFLWRAWGCPKPQSSNNPFTDVKKGTFYYDAVLWAVENGITNGATATTFNPDGVCNRAQVVTFLWRSLGQPKPKSTANPFTDVPGGTWYTDAVLWALEKKVTTGATATTFNPNGNCQRAHVVTFLYRAVQSQG